MGVSMPFCSHCQVVDEKILHVMRDCPLASMVWMHLSRVDHRADFFGLQLDRWILWNLNMRAHSMYGISWLELWANACHLIWFWRNKDLHDANFVRPIRPWERLLKLIV